MRAALGLIETIGLTTAITALDAASKAADVTLIGYDKVIGVGKAVSVTVHIAGEVAAVKAAVDAGVSAGNRVGTVVSGHVIPRPHEEVDRLIAEFEKNLKDKNEVSKTEQKKDDKKQKKVNTEEIKNKEENKK
ncbi:BMC domain-containing protein [Brassicibacter mesophilus]|uniref:BMC domain-containing protein n=1 Tax=Brassicibacter mesophilus TaxID=745119 RepID=UPI003D1B59DA